MWDELYKAIDVIGARDGENEWGMGCCPQNADTERVRSISVLRV
jgi:hypothetical protein